MAWYLCDGYNLLFALNKSHQSLESERSELLDELRAFCEEKGDHVTVVFDAHEESAPYRRSHLGPLEVVFTGPNETADDAILHLLETDKTQWIVVTNDRDIKTKAAYLGFPSISCRALWKAVTSHTPSAGEAVFPPTEFVRWLEIFEKRLEDNDSNPYRSE